jgi:hypothetical protein
VKSKGTSIAQKARWAAWRAAQADTLTMGDLAIREDRRKRQAKWWANLSPEKFKDQIEKRTCAGASGATRRRRRGLSE